MGSAIAAGNVATASSRTAGSVSALSAAVGAASSFSQNCCRNGFSMMTLLPQRQHHVAGSRILATPARTSSPLSHSHALRTASLKSGLLSSQCSTCKFSPPSFLSPYLLQRYPLSSLSLSYKSELHHLQSKSRFTSTTPDDTRQTLRVRACESSNGTNSGVTGELSAERKEFIVTTPLYYVNAAPHMGSAYPTIAADALARFQRLQGRPVIFVTGTDEHGEKIALAAEANGRSPREHVDQVAEDYRALWKELGISQDRFIRTSAPRHAALVREFFQRVWDQGDIYRADYEGLYCVACEEYKDEKDLLEDKCCPTHRKPCVERKEDNYFFALSKYQKELEEVFESNPNFVRPSFRKNEVLGWVGEGLRDFSISRAAVEWGIPVPADPKQTIYVWFDALLGYLTALLEEGQEPTLANVLATGHWPASVHIIGKDILRFHAVYWPAMLMSAGLPIPNAVYGHGFLTKDGLKMGKSLGNTLEPKDLVSRYGSDAVRYFFLREIEFGKDGDFAEERFVQIVNANLANTIGNLLNRTLGLLKKNCAGAIPVDTSSIPASHPLRIQADEWAQKAAQEYAELQFGAACEAALGLATAGNVYLDDRAPWSLFKRGGDAEKDEAAKDLAVVLEVVRVVAILLLPVTPGLSRKIYLQLGYSNEDFESLRWDQTRWGGLKAGQKMAEAVPVFQRIEDPTLEIAPTPQKKEGKKKSGKMKQKQVEAAPATITTS